MMRCTTAALKCVDFVTRMEDSYLCTGGEVLSLSSL